MKKFLFLIALFTLFVGANSVKAYTIKTKTPILLTGGKFSECFTSGTYYIEMNGWQNFTVYEDATGVAFDENSTMVFDMAEQSNNDQVRVVFTYEDGTTSEIWWCTGIGSSADDPTTQWNHKLDNSTFWLKKGLGANFDSKKDLKITKVTVNNQNVEGGIYKINGGTVCGETMTIKKQGQWYDPTVFGTLGGEFSATAAFSNIFQMKPFEVGDNQKIVIKFGEAVPSTGDWRLNNNSGLTSLSGKTEYEFALDGTAISDFTIFNWDANPDPIKISEVYFYKEEEEYTTLDFNKYGYASVDKKYLTATDGLSYNTETGVVSSNGAAGTLVLELESPVDLRNLNSFNVPREGANDTIISRLKFFDNDGTLINTWNGNRLGNAGLDNNATNAFINNNPVKKLVWESDAKAGNNGKSFTITGVKFQLKLMSSLKAGETILNTLNYYNWNSTAWESATPTWNIRKTTDTYYGDGSSKMIHYVDLTDYSELRIYRDDNAGFRSWFATSNTGNGSTDGTLIDGSNDAASWNSEGKYWSIDLTHANIPKNGEGKIWLIAIKSGAWGVNNIINNIVVYKAPAANAAQYNLTGSGMQLAETVAALADATATSIDATGVIGITTNSEGGRTLLESANSNCLFLGKVGNGYLANTNNVVDGDACASLVLTDGNYPFKAPSTFTASSVSYNRTFTVGKASTVCLPFELSKEEAHTAGTFYTLTAYEGGTLTFTEIGENDGTEAYKPYLFKAASGTPFSSAYANKEIAETPATLTGTTVEGYTLTGVLTGSTDVAADNPDKTVYGWSGNDGEEEGKFVKVGSGVSIDPFRAYVVYNGSGNNARLAARFVGGSVTGINEVSEAQGFMNFEGKVFENGKIVIYKKGMKFNANGARLK